MNTFSVRKYVCCVVHALTVQFELKKKWKKKSRDGFTFIWNFLLLLHLFSSSIPAAHPLVLYFIPFIYTLLNWQRCRDERILHTYSWRFFVALIAINYSYQHNNRNFNIFSFPFNFSKSHESTLWYRDYRIHRNYSLIFCTKITFGRWDKWCRRDIGKI